MSSNNKVIVDRKDIPADRNAYVYRNPQKGGRWYLYFYDKETKKRHRFSLRDGNGNFPTPTTEGQDEAWVLGIAKFVELKGKSDRGEAIKSLSWGEMTKKFLSKEEKRITAIPHNGITATRFRLLKSQIRWLSEFVDEDKKAVHKFKKNSFINYEIWRKERSKEYGKQIPVPTTINQELSTLRRCFYEVAVTEGFLTESSVPTIPSVKLPKDKKHRRDEFSEHEWIEMEKAMRYYWTKGRTRILDDRYTILKNEADNTYRTKPNVTRTPRGRMQLKHREMLYWMMRICKDTGIRIGSVRQIRWRHLDKATTRLKKDQKIWVFINVPAENTKTGRSYRVAAPIAKHLEHLRKVNQFKTPNDFLFCNQRTGQPFSQRILSDALCEVLVEARLADWSEDDSNNNRKIDIHSGKTLNWYGFRHSYITESLRNGVPVALVAANTDTSLKYIEDHYFHYKADESTDQLGKGRFLKSGSGDLSWINEVITPPISRGDIASG